MLIRYAVTFEFETRPPVTHKGTVEASQVHACAAKAIRQAQQALRLRQWSSLVFVAWDQSGLGTPASVAQPSRRHPRAPSGTPS